MSTTFLSTAQMQEDFAPTHTYNTNIPPKPTEKKGTSGKFIQRLCVFICCNFSIINDLTPSEIYFYYETIMVFFIITSFLNNKYKCHFTSIQYLGSTQFHEFKCHSQTSTRDIIFKYFQLMNGILYYPF